AGVTSGAPNLLRTPARGRSFASWLLECWENTAAEESTAKESIKESINPEERVPTLPRLELPTTGGASSALAVVRRVPLGASLSKRITALSAAEGVTVGVTVLAGFVALVHRFTDAEDIVVDMDSRRGVPAELGDAIGPCATTVRLRADLSNSTCFRDL